MFFIGEKEVFKDYKFSSTPIESDISPEKYPRRKNTNKVLGFSFLQSTFLEKLNCEVQQRQKVLHFFGSKFCTNLKLKVYSHGKYFSTKR